MILTDHQTGQTRFRDWIAGFGAVFSPKAEMALGRAGNADRHTSYEYLSDAEFTRMGIPPDGIAAQILRHCRRS